MVESASVVKIYINGTLIDTAHINKTYPNTNNLLIGRGQFNSTFEGFNGVLDDIRIYNRVLSACEVNQLYNSQNFKITTSPNTICSGQPFTINAIGASNYAWNTGASTSSITVTPSISTVYSVTTTYSAGCSETRTLNITVNPSPTVSVTSGAICANQSFTMVSSGASTYTYSSGSAIVSSTTNATYYYSVTGTDANGCVSTNTAVS